MTDASAMRSGCAPFTLSRASGDNGTAWPPLTPVTTVSNDDWLGELTDALAPSERVAAAKATGAVEHSSKDKAVNV